MTCEQPYLEFVERVCPLPLGAVTVDAHHVITLVKESKDGDGNGGSYMMEKPSVAGVFQLSH